MDSPAKCRSAAGCELVRDVARQFGEVRVKIIGSSMIPAIWPGDVLTVRHREPAELQPGQIVLYQREEMLIAHRITSIQGANVITRGDSVQREDASIGEREIVGEVVCVLRNGRRVQTRQTHLQRGASFFVRRSDSCKRMMLGIGLRILRCHLRETLPRETLPKDTLPREMPCLS
jgi:signal peptidase I